MSSVTIDPTVPADTESPRQGAARIRAVESNLLALLSQSGGAPVTFTNPPFNVNTSGEVIVPGLKQVLVAFARQPFTTVSVGTGATTIASVAVTMPSIGGPFRALASYEGFCGDTVGGGFAGIITWISDGPHAWAQNTVQWDAVIQPGTGWVCARGTEFSPTAYPNGQVVTFFLKAAANATGHSIGYGTPSQGLSSQITIAVFSST